MIRIPRGKANMPGHRHRRIGKRLERGDIAFQFSRAGGDGRQFLVTVGHGAAMPRHVLDRADHARAGQPVQHRPANRRHTQRLAAIGAIADHIVGAGLANIEHGGVRASDADFGKVMTQRLGIGAGRLNRGSGGEVKQPVECRTGRIGQPFRRFHPRDPPAFLIDRDQQAVPSVQVAQTVGQRAKLGAAFDIAAEHDIARRVRVLEKGALVSGQGQTGQAEDSGRHGRSIRSNRPISQAQARTGMCKSPGRSRLI